MRSARRFVVDLLQVWGLDDLVDSAALLTSELATNAALHTRRPFEVAVQRQRAGIRVEVHDRSPDPPTLPPPPSSAAVTAQAVAGDVLAPDALEADRLFSGLNMVDAVATDWGIQPEPGEGKVVWFELRSMSPRHYAGMQDLRRPPAPERFEEPTTLPGLDDARSPALLRTLVVLAVVLLAVVGVGALLWAGWFLGG